MGNPGRSGMRANVVRLAVVAVFAAALAVPIAAHAASFSARVPASGSSAVLTDGKIAVSGYDSAGVRGASSYSMTLDGVKVKATISYTKRGDYRRFRLTYRSSVVTAPGPHAVTVKVRDRRGHWTTTRWKFTARAPLSAILPMLLDSALPGASSAGFSDIEPSYVGTATIHLDPPVGGRCFYALDGGLILEGTTVVVPPPASETAAHRLSFLFVDADGNAGVPMAAAFSVSAPPVVPPADVTAPVTVCDAQSAYVGPATVTLTATDDRPGIVRTFWSLDGGPVSEGPIVVPAPDEESVMHVLAFWSVDAAGNEESHRSVNFTVTADRIIITPPPPPHETAGPCVVSGCHSALIVDVHARVGCPACHQNPTVTLDSYECESCHEVEDLLATHDFLPPNTTSDARDSYVGDAEITLYPMDASPFPHPAVIGWNIAEVNYRLDDGPIQTVRYTLGSSVVVRVPAPRYVPNAEEHVLEFWSVDLLGNVEWQHKQVAFTVDSGLIGEVPHLGEGPCVASTCHDVRMTAVHAVPGCISCHGSGITPSFVCEDCHDAEDLGDSHDFLPPNTTTDAKASYVGTATIHLYPMDRSNQPIASVIGAGIAATYYRLDGGALREVTGNLGNGVTIVVPEPASGTVQHTLEFWSVDTHGNPEFPHKSVAFTIEHNLPIHIGPPTPPGGSDLLPSYIGTATIHLYPGATWGAMAYYRLDSGPQTMGTTIVVPAPASGTAFHTLSYMFIEPSGNATSWRTATFSVSAPPN